MLEALRAIRDILCPVQRLTLRCKIAIGRLWPFFIGKQLIHGCNFLFPYQVALLPIAIEFDKILSQQVVTASAHFPAVYLQDQMQQNRENLAPPAATQVDVHEQVIVIDVSETHDQPLVLINPEITWRSDEVIVAEEGCLSVPAIYDAVSRHERISVRALGRDGQVFELQAEGLLAVCVQHEIDHLLGKVFVDYLSALKRDRIRTNLLKRQREQQRA